MPKDACIVKVRRDCSGSVTKRKVVILYSVFIRRHRKLWRTHWVCLRSWKKFVLQNRAFLASLRDSCWRRVPTLRLSWPWQVKTVTNKCLPLVRCLCVEFFTWLLSSQSATVMINCFKQSHALIVVNLWWLHWIENACGVIVRPKNCKVQNLRIRLLGNYHYIWMYQMLISHAAW